MNYTIVSLRGILAQTDSEDSVCALLNTFKCSRDHDREHFLWNLAIQFEKRCMSRTYLAVDVSDPSHILGYFSLGMKCLRLREDAPISRSMRNKMNVDSETDIAQSYLIGQLGRSDDSPKGLGAMLLIDALDLIRQSSEIVGCRVVRLDCSSNVESYYTSQGWKRVGTNESRSLIQMAIVL